MRVALSAARPSLSVLRARIDAALLGLGAELVSDVQLVATELITNAYRHGRPPVLFQLRYPFSDGVVRVEVSDSSAGLPEVRRLDLTLPHGRGLLLVEGCSSRWGVTQSLGGKTVWAEFVPR